MSALATWLLVVSLVLGGSGASVYAAQDVLPNHPLYPIKILSEDAQVRLAADSAARANLSIRFANRRAQEMMDLIAQGLLPPDAVLVREQAEIATALRLAADLDDQAMHQELLRVRETIQQQLQIMVAGQPSQEAEPELARVREMLRTQLALADLGLENPQLFRSRIRQTTQTRTGLESETPTPESTTAGHPQQLQQQDQVRQQLQEHDQTQQQLQQRDQLQQEQRDQAQQQLQQQDQTQQQLQQQDQTQQQLQQQDQTQQQLQQQDQTQQQVQQQQQKSGSNAQPSASPVPPAGGGGEPGPNGSGGRR